MLRIEKYILVVLASLSILIPAKASAGYTVPGTLAQQEPDSLFAADLILKGRQFYTTGDYDTALVVLNRALDLSINSDLPLQEAETYFLMGLITDRFDEWELTLRYYLKAAKKFSDLGQTDREGEIYS
ncbi:MAG: hypothetical protein R2744_03940 [Bacteroidales bacterium]